MLALARHCGIGYNSAWLIKQKIMHAFLQAEQHNPLAGVVHVDDGYLGGKRQGVRSRGAHGKTPFITALSLVNGRKLHYQDRVRCTQIAYRDLQGSSRMKSLIGL